jgi:hypothetical protein
MPSKEYRLEALWKNLIQDVWLQIHKWLLTIEIN